MSLEESLLRELEAVYTSTCSEPEETVYRIAPIFKVYNFCGFEVSSRTSKIKLHENLGGGYQESLNSETYSYFCKIFVQDHFRKLCSLKFSDIWYIREGVSYTAAASHAH